MFRMLALAAALGLAGCASDIMKSYVGKDVTEAMADYGPPAATFDMPDGRRAFQWRQNVAFAMPTTTGFTAVQSGALTVGTATTTGGGIVGQTCVYTVYGQKNPAGSYTIVGFRPPRPDCE